MADFIFEHENNRGLLSISTHNGVKKIIECHKDDSQMFRVGGTAANKIMMYKGKIVSINHAEKIATVQLLDIPLFLNGLLYDSYHSRLALGNIAFVTEYYTIDMEGKSPGWLITPFLIKQSEVLFINVDCIDGGGNIIKRYRISPYTAEFKIMEMGVLGDS